MGVRSIEDFWIIESYTHKIRIDQEFNNYVGNVKVQDSESSKLNFGKFLHKLC